MTQDQEKHLAAQAAAELVEDGMIVGLGTGSTAKIVVDLLGERVKQGLRIKAIPTSVATMEQATALGIPIVTLEEATHPDIDIDGADEVSPSLALIKGGGGALLREKIVAYASRRFVVIVDSKKLVDKLGKFRLPVEVIPFSQGIVEDTIKSLNGNPVVRKEKDGKLFRTDENNLILDCDFGLIDNPHELANKLSLVPGIVEHGLFIDMAESVIIGQEGGVRVLKRQTADRHPASKI